MGQRWSRDVDEYGDDCYRRTFYVEVKAFDEESFLAGELADHYNGPVRIVDLDQPRQLSCWPLHPVDRRIREKI